MAAAVDDYLAKLPDDRRAALARLRELVNAHLPPGFEEGIQYGMLAWFVPKSRLAETYNGQPLCLAALASQKGYMSLYLMSVYGDPALRQWFEAAFARAGKRLDMGKSCVRFKTLDALPLEVIGQAIAKVTVDRYVEIYHQSRAQTAAAKPAQRSKPGQLASRQPGQPGKRKPGKSTGKSTKPTPRKSAKPAARKR